MPLRKIKNEIFEYQGNVKGEIINIFSNYALINENINYFEIPSIPGMSIVIRERTSLKHYDPFEPRPNMGPSMKTIIDSVVVKMNYLEDTPEEDLNEVRGLLKKIKCL